MRALILQVGTAVGSYTNTVFAMDDYAGVQAITGTKRAVQHDTTEALRVWITGEELDSVAWLRYVDSGLTMTAELVL